MECGFDINFEDSFYLDLDAIKFFVLHDMKIFRLKKNKQQNSGTFSVGVMSQYPSSCFLKSGFF